jgi:hypothetical protein
MAERDKKEEEEPVVQVEEQPAENNWSFYEVGKYFLVIILAWNVIKTV